ncbi:MAG: hypothetical protein M3Q99_09235 [Acidobacteriota bacterium]|nr:hypothetical protein [Acidobacteriota bacterium]
MPQRTTTLRAASPFWNWLAFRLAGQGVVARTVSSFGLHTEHHQVSDEIKTIDLIL